MIPILTDTYPVVGHGLGGLNEAIDCVVTHEINGEYELMLQYPITGQHYSELLPNYLILATSKNNTTLEPFRIYRITKPLNGIVTVYARHFCYDAAGIIVEPFTSGSLTQLMLDLPSKCTPASPVTVGTTRTVATSYTLKAPRPLWRVLGGQEGSILDVYGGEWDFSGTSATLKTQLGQDNGVKIVYGKNLTELEQDASLEATYSGVYPYWYDEETNTLVTLTEKYVTITGAAVSNRILILDLTSDFETQPTETQLRDRTNAYITANSVGSMKTSWNVSFVQLSQAGEYENQAALEKVDLGDTVSVYYEALGVNASARVVKTEFDSLKEQYREVTIGRVKQNLADIIVGQNEVMDEKIDKTKSALERAIDSATDFITNGGGYMRFIFDSSNNLTEIVSMDNPDISQATNVWRWNNGGFGFSSNGYSGPYTLAMTQDGQIVADFITTGNLNAARITTGIIKDALNKNSWNLDTGALTITDGTINIQTSSDNFDAIRLYYGSKSVQLNPTTLLFETSTESASVGATGFYINKLSGTSLSSLQKAGLILKEESGNNVIQRGKIGSNGAVYQYDTNENQRTYLDEYGLYFYNASGTTTAQYPATRSFSAISPYSSRITVDSGGYYKMGSTCFVNVVFTGAYTATNGPRITNALPVPAMSTPLLCLDITNDLASTSEAVNCFINTSGYIYTKTLTTGHKYIVSGTYTL